MSRTKWILLVEDSANDADLALHALSVHSTSEEVIVARDGAEALDCLYRRARFAARPAGDPAVVLLDLKMPRVDGLEVLRQVKGDPRMKHIPVAMFTSSGEEADLARSYLLGANAYVVKPVDFAKFTLCVKEIRKFWMTLNVPPPDSSRPADNGGPAGMSVSATSCDRQATTS